MPALNLGPVSQIIEQYMLDEITIRRPVEPVLDNTTLLLTDTYTEVYNGKAFIAPTGVPFPTVLGGAQTSDTHYEVAIPGDSDPILPNDEITCDESVYNEQMVGIVFIVVGQVETTFFTHRRVIVYKHQSAV